MTALYACVKTDAGKTATAVMQIFRRYCGYVLIGAEHTVPIQKPTDEDNTCMACELRSRSASDRPTDCHLNVCHTLHQLPARSHPHTTALARRW